MILIKDNKCDFCGCCVGVCPVNCIELKVIMGKKTVQVKNNSNLQNGHLDAKVIP